MCITLARKLRVVVVGREGVYLCWIRAGLGCGGGAWMVGRCNILNIQTSLRLWGMVGEVRMGRWEVLDSLLYIQIRRYVYIDTNILYTDTHMFYAKQLLLCGL